MSHFSSKTSTNVKRASIPPRYVAEHLRYLATMAAHSGWEGSASGPELKSIHFQQKKQCQAQGEISGPIYTNSLCEPACGNKLMLFISIVLEESFHWSLGKPWPKKLIPESLSLFRMPCFIYMPCCKSVVTLKVQVAKPELSHSLIMG